MGVVAWISGCNVGLQFGFRWWGFQFAGVMGGSDGDGSFGWLFCFGCG